MAPFDSLFEAYEIIAKSRISYEPSTNLGDGSWTEAYPILQRLMLRGMMKWYDSIQSHLCLQAPLLISCQPLNIVQEKAKLERSASQRAATTSVPAQAPLKRQQQQVNLFDEFPEAAPAPRSNSAAPAPAPGRAPQAPPPTSAAPQKPPAKAGESLLGFDFFGSSQSNPPSRPSSAAASTANSTMPSRPDLKQSILSLYSSAAKNPTSGQQQQAHSRSVSQQAPGGGLDDAFSSLSFSSQPQSPPLTQSQSSPFANLAGPTSKPVTSPPASMSSARPSSIGGNFFDSKPQIKPGPAPPITTTSVPQPPRVQRGLSSSSGFGDFTSPESPKAPEPPIKTPNNGVNDLFDFSEPAQPALPAQPIKPTQPIAPSTTSTFSPFNLSAPKPASQPAPPPQSVSQPQPPSSTSATSSVANASSMMNMDPWGSGDAWASSTSPGASKPPLKSAPTTSMDFGGGWESHGSGGAKTPPQSAKITAEEDFGGWESSAPTSAQASNTTAVPKPAGGMGGADDLFSNVWE